MADFHALNHEWMRTIQEIKDVLDKENALCELWAAGDASPEMAAKIRAIKGKVEAALAEHDAAREALCAAGFLPR